MSKKDQESPLVLVFDILKENEGCFLSALEIFSAIYEKHRTSLHMNTIRGALEDLQIVQGQIEREVHRLGPRRIHTAVFRLPKLQKS